MGSTGLGGVSSIYQGNHLCLKHVFQGKIGKRKDRSSFWVLTLWVAKGRHIAPDPTPRIGLRAHIPGEVSHFELWSEGEGI